MSCDNHTPCHDRGDDTRHTANPARADGESGAPLALAAVVYRAGDALENMLAAVRDRLVTRPATRIAGLVPRNGPPHSNGRASLWLDDVGRGDSIALSQDLGPGSTSCILSADGLATARVRLAAAIATRPDLVLFGRFAKEELAGRGIREEVGLAVADDIPALVAVEQSMLPGWIEFAGEDWSELPFDLEAIVGWFDALTSKRRATSS
uniref:Molybdenum ABC transporter ATP-binding protein n=1 Tax=Rhodopseudomonas palustris (strain BisA53) TaxID=316055 RepID=Q07KW5_RHOP5